MAQPAKDEINKQNLKSVLDNHRLEMQMQTSELLDEVSEVNNTFIKRIYNYNLATNRNNYEAILDVKKEYFGMREDPALIKIW